MGLHELTLSLSSHSLKLDIFRAEPIRFPLREAGFSAVAGAALRCRLGHFQLGVASENSTGQLERNFFFFFFFFFFFSFFLSVPVKGSGEERKKEKERKRKKTQQKTADTPRSGNAGKTTKMAASGVEEGSHTPRVTPTYSNWLVMISSTF